MRVRADRHRSTDSCKMGSIRSGISDGLSLRSASNTTANSLPVRLASSMPGGSAGGGGGGSRVANCVSCAEQFSRVTSVLLSTFHEFYQLH